MIAVRHLLVAALLVLAGARHRSAGGGVGAIHGDLALIDVIAVLVVVGATALIVARRRATRFGS